ncbi:CU044_5270 family protein [Streptomyces sp. NPDC091290]|uniref:CU044_5270 family protein n=1 Tax=Streptomyces sp. NPDC091290 TaxID=3365990 RepID=UPI0038253390
MDDLGFVRETGADTPPLSATARSAARRRLQKAILEESRLDASAVSRRVVFRFAMAATVAVSAAGTAYVVSPDDRKTHTPRIETVSAAKVLHNAADRSRSGSASLPVPRNDQYVYTETFITQTPLKGGKTKTWHDESWLSVDGSRPSRREEHGKVHYDAPLKKNVVVSPPNEYSQLKKWPTDPDELLKWLGHGQNRIAGPPRHEGDDTTALPRFDPDMSVYTEACLLMKGPRVMPPGLQAAAFEALAKLPRVRVDRDEVDALGRHGIGVSYPGTSFSLVFDRTTYDYLGMRQKGSHAELIDGDWRQVDWYWEMTSREKVGVVNRIGQRP